MTSATTIHLVRHAHHDQLDRILVGRMEGVRLSARGRCQSRRLAERFARLSISRFQSSPRERARETAIIADRSGAGIELTAALDEIDFGAWSGRSFAELESDARWRAWNTVRSGTRAPGGETMAEMHARVSDHLTRMTAVRPGERLLLVSHAEVIRAVVLACSGLSFDAFQQVEIAPASVTTLCVENGETTVVAVNDRTHLQDETQSDDPMCAAEARRASV